MRFWGALECTKEVDHDGSNPPQKKPLYDDTCLFLEASNNEQRNESFGDKYFHPLFLLFYFPILLLLFL